MTIRFCKLLIFCKDIFLFLCPGQRWAPSAVRESAVSIWAHSQVDQCSLCLCLCLMSYVIRLCLMSYVLCLHMSYALCSMSICLCLMFYRDKFPGSFYCNNDLITTNFSSPIFLFKISVYTRTTNNVRYEEKFQNDILNSTFFFIFLAHFTVKF